MHIVPYIPLPEAPFGEIRAGIYARCNSIPPPLRAEELDEGTEETIRRESGSAFHRSHLILFVSLEIPPPLATVASCGRRGGPPQ